MKQTDINKLYKRDSKPTINESSSKYDIKGRNMCGIWIKHGLTKQYCMLVYCMAQPENSLSLPS